MAYLLTLAQDFIVTIAAIVADARNATTYVNFGHFVDTLLKA